MSNPLKVSLENIIPLTEARDHFSQIVNEVQKDKLYILTKGGKPAVAIVDVKYLEQITNGNVNTTHVETEIQKNPAKVGRPEMLKHDAPRPQTSSSDGGQAKPFNKPTFQSYDKPAPKPFDKPAEDKPAFKPSVPAPLHHEPVKPSSPVTPPRPQMSEHKDSEPSKPLTPPTVNHDQPKPATPVFTPATPPPTTPSTPLTPATPPAPAATITTNDTNSAFKTATTPSTMSQTPSTPSPATPATSVTPPTSNPILNSQTPSAPKISPAQASVAHLQNQPHTEPDDMQID